MGGDVLEQLVDPHHVVGPAPLGSAPAEAPVGAPLEADALPELDDLHPQRPGELGQLVEGVADLAFDPDQVVGQPHLELSAAERPQGGQQLAVVQGMGLGSFRFLHRYVR